MRLQLREYQADALARVAAAEARGVRRQLGVAATGLGKTVIFCSLAEQRGKRAIILAHRDELVTQAAAKVLELWPDLGATDNVHVALRAGGQGELSRHTRLDPRGVGIVKAGANDVHAQVVVASVQTLARSKRLQQLVEAYTPSAHGNLLATTGTEPFDLVVVDEAHHAAADSYRNVLAALGAGTDVCNCGHTKDAHYAEDMGGSTRAVRCSLNTDTDEPDCWCHAPEYQPGPLLLGVTATPDRGDGKGLDDLFDEVAFTYDILWGIRAGYLADLRGLRVTVDSLDLSAVKVRRGDYDQGAAGRAMEDAEVPRHVVAAWLEHALGRRTLVFTPTVEVARLVQEQFAHVGVRAAYVHGGTPTDERRQILQAYSRGDIDVLANCAVLTEGYDEPRTDCIVVARPTRSRALYTQMVGRGTRRHPDKADCLVLDIVGASAEHSLVTVPSLFGLEGQYAERMGDGSGELAGVVQDRDDEQVRLGRMRAEDADLFRKVRTTGIAWVQVHKDGDQLRRYVRPLGKTQGGDPLPTVVLAQREPGEDVWTAGLWWQDTDTKRVLLADASMEMAQGVAEDYVRKNGSVHLTTAEAGWRARKPSAKALAAAKKWRLPVDPDWTAGELSEALDAHIARIKSRPRKPKGPAA
jgi:ATP-dependent helicase IRC3